MNWFREWFSSELILNQSVDWFSVNNRFIWRIDSFIPESCSSTQLFPPVPEPRICCSLPYWRLVLYPVFSTSPCPTEWIPPPSCVLCRILLFEFDQNQKMIWVSFCPLILLTYSAMFIVWNLWVCDQCDWSYFDPVTPVSYYVWLCVGSMPTVSFFSGAKVNHSYSIFIQLIV